MRKVLFSYLLAVCVALLLVLVLGAPSHAAYVPGVATLPINLAGGGGVVTGALPDGNQAAQSLGGDLSGTTAAATVQAISGSTPIIITPAVLQWSASTVSPKIAQSSPISDVATSNLIVQSQAPFASAVTHVSPGNIALTLPAPVSGDGTGNSGYVSVTDGSADILRFGYGLNSQSGQATIFAPNALPLTIQSNGSYVHLIGVGNSYIDADDQQLRTSNGGTILAEATTSKLAVLSSAFTANAWTGSANTQTLGPNWYAIRFRTSGAPSTFSTGFTFTLAAHHGAVFDFLYSGRVVVAGIGTWTPVDLTRSGHFHASVYYTGSGSATVQYSTQVVTGAASDPTASVTTSSGVVTLNVVYVDSGTPTIDWQGDLHLVPN